MKTERQVQVWADNWIHRQRPGTIRPFWLSQLLYDFQLEVLGEQKPCR